MVIIFLKQLKFSYKETNYRETDDRKRVTSSIQLH